MTAVRSICTAVVRFGSAMTPCGSAAPLTIWLIDIALAWAALWLSLNHYQSLTTLSAAPFFVACALTVLYGMRVQREARALSFGPSRPPDQRAITQARKPLETVKASLAGTALLGALSISPFVPLIIVGAALSGTWEGLLIPLLALTVWTAVAIGGFVLQLTLMSAGRLLAALLMRIQPRAL